MKHPEPRRMAAEVGDDAADLVKLLEEATAVQWHRSRLPSVAGDPGIRSKGELSRPTEDVALDPLRLALREEVAISARLLVRTHRDLYRQRGRLLRALERWQGERDDSAFVNK